MEWPFLIPAFPFLMVLGIVWIRTRAQLEEKRIAAQASARTNGEASSLASGRVDELEERVRILERIVTDGGYDLAQKIEALRDERPVDLKLASSRSRETI
jgi:hypothetical protein